MTAIARRLIAARLPQYIAIVSSLALESYPQSTMQELRQELLYSFLCTREQQNVPHFRQLKERNIGTE